MIPCLMKENGKFMIKWAMSSILKVPRMLADRGQVASMDLHLQGVEDSGEIQAEAWKWTWMRYFACFGERKG